MSEIRPVALDIQGPYAGGGATANPLAPMQSMVETMRGMAALRQQNAEWAARTQAAETIAAGGSPEDIQRRLMANPQVGAYLPQLMANYNQGVLAYQHGQQVVTTTAQSGMEGAMRAIFGTVDHPELLHDAIGAQLAPLSPEARTRDEPYLRSIEQGLLAGLPSDPRQWTDEDRRLYNQHVMGFGIAGKVDPEQGYRLMGIPGPQLGQAGTFPYSPWAPQGGAGRPYGGVAAGGPGGPSLGGPPPAAGGQPQYGPGQVSATPLAPSSPKAADGTDLWGPNDFAGGDYTTRGLGNKVIYATQGAEDLNKSFYSGEGKQAFDALNSSAGELAEFGHNLDMMVRPGGGGFTDPGRGGTIRSELANALLTAGRALGIKDVDQWIKEIGVDPTKVAFAQDMQKVTRRLAYSLDNQVFGRARMAASVVNNTFEAVPGLENTPLGSKLMLANIQAKVNMALDERRFMDQWSQLHGGDMTGAQDRFYDRHNPANYAKQALRNFGIDPDTHRFVSWDVVQNYIKAGYLKGNDVGAMPRGVLPPGRPPDAT